MAGAKRVRWECPNGLHAGVLGSTRPPRDSIVRYCLPCSQEAGRLVERTAPALERQRAARTARSSEKAAAKREREREAERRRYVVTVGGGVELDLRAEMDAMFRASAELRDRARESGETARWRPELTVRNGGKGHVSGHCDGYTGDITITAGRGASVDETREVLLHELVHAVTVAIVPRSGRRRRRTGRISNGKDWHGSLYRTALCRAAGEVFGVKVHPDDHAEAYGLDRIIVARMREQRMTIEELRAEADGLAGDAATSREEAEGCADAPQAQRQLVKQAEAFEAEATRLRWIADEREGA